ncbi:MAG: hypothetical protein IK144_12010 [Bacteroidaceae bacterium]|nr:hypothetical protein [Bacteroidaceae bacterium]
MVILVQVWITCGMCNSHQPLIVPVVKDYVMMAVVDVTLIYRRPGYIRSHTDCGPYCHN